jgi:transcriptional regulator with XRE-family HTH domain
VVPTEEIDIGRRIRAARALADLSASDVGDRIGLSKDTMRKYEGGHRVPKADVIERVAQACGLPVEFFYVDLSVLADWPAAMAGQLSAIQDRLARIEAELRIRR